MPSVHRQASKLPGDSVPGPFYIGFFHDPDAVKEISEELSEVYEVEVGNIFVGYLHGFPQQHETHIDK